MTYQLILTIITLFVGFSLSFVSFYLYSKKIKTVSSNVLKKELAFAPIYLCCVVFLSLLYLITPIEDDFIHDFRATETFIPLLLAGICYTLSLFSKTAKFLDIALIFSVAVSISFLPQDFLMFNGIVPFWADRILIFILWSVFSCFYFILNGIDGILATFNSAYLLTLVILCFLDAAPLFYGLAGLSLLTINGSFMIFNWCPAKIKLTDNSCKIFGFILGALMVFGSSENLAPCFSIILTLFALELLQSLAKKLSLRDRYNKLSSNTIYYQAHIRGLAPQQVCFAIIKIQLLFIILSCFQAYLPNATSLPIASLFLAAWFLNKLQHWDEPNQNIKEINQEFMNDLRQNINDFKNTINRD